MKKTYETPSIEKIAFQYRDQVVAASVPSGVCSQQWVGREDYSNDGCRIEVVVAHAGRV